MQYFAFDDKKKDGLGAQMIRRFYLWGYCKITDNVEYVHVPLRMVWLYQVEVKMFKKLMIFIILLRTKIHPKI